MAPPSMVGFGIQAGTVDGPASVACSSNGYRTHASPKGQTPIENTGIQGCKLQIVSLAETLSHMKHQQRRDREFAWEQVEILESTR